MNGPRPTLNGEKRRFRSVWIASGKRMACVLTFGGGAMIKMDVSRNAMFADEAYFDSSFSAAILSG